MGTSEKTVGGLAGWLLGRLRRGGRNAPRLSLLERIALGPRQSLALVEAEGRRFLVATSTEGAPAFYALDERRLPGNRSSRRQTGAGRASW
ncbi:MAG TPA: flagellar biosynthetic protein FliO [Terracidiphilus sp.]|jgi:flagellar biogenesis protein FliO